MITLVFVSYEAVMKEAEIITGSSPKIFPAVVNKSTLPHSCQQVKSDPLIATVVKN